MISFTALMTAPLTPVILIPQSTFAGLAA